jgi:hypothetical protein
VYGTSAQNVGVYGESQSPNNPGATGVNKSGGPGVWGFSSQNEGVRGESQSPGHAGVTGVNSGGSIGVYGSSSKGAGVYGESLDFEGVHGVSHNPNHGGVVGICDKPNGIGVFGFCDDGSNSLPGTGVFGKSSQGEGLHGETNSTTFAAVAGITLNPAGTGAGVYGESRGKGPAGFFQGNVVVTGDIFLPGADCAEQFDVSGEREVGPGTVVVIDSNGALRESRQAYDRKVAGVVSGAGEYRHAIVLDGRPSQEKRIPVALVGKVYCKVDAGYSPIEVGDLLTTSPTPGHAMKASESEKVFGSVIGKALRTLEEGQGVIPILVALQ